jgi:hypothetical protein
LNPKDPINNNSFIQQLNNLTCTRNPGTPNAGSTGKFGDVAGRPLLPMGDLQDPKMEVLYHISSYKAIFCGDIPLHRPKT